MAENRKYLKISSEILHYYDNKLLLSVLLLVGIGIVMIYSASSTIAIKIYGSDFYFVKKQALFAMLGILGLMACRYIPYRTYQAFAYPLLLCAIALLLAVKITPFGATVGGATRWLKIGFITIQPSEIARITLIIYLAYSLSKKKDTLHDFYIGFIPHVMVLALFAFLIYLQPDYGSIVILAAITWIMLFVGGVKIIHLSSTFLFALPVMYLLMITAAYRVKRILSFLDPWKHADKEGYQIIHSLMAFGTGGIVGEGIGKGYQKMFYLPEPHTDFILSVIGEELGLVGVLLVLTFYVTIIWRGINIAKNAADIFGSYLAVGLTVSIGLQVSINMGVALGMLPPKGLTLPFLSYGGTSLLLNMIAVGILMNIGASKSK